MRSAILLTCGLLASCGSFVAPAGNRASVVSAPTAGELVAVEGRPAGVVLRLRAETTAAQAVLFRADGSAEPHVLQAIALSPQTRALLAGGVEVVDSTIGPGRSMYQFALVDEAGTVVGRSSVLVVTWTQPPPRLTDVVVSAPFVDAVELHWAPPAGFGAAVFRRDVLAEGARFERIADLPAGANRWADRDVGPGGVWSYRISLTYRSPEGLVQMGPPSEEAYASTPEGP